MGHHFNDFILNINHEHVFTTGDCSLKIFLNTMKQHRLVFNLFLISVLLVFDMFQATNDLELASGLFHSLAMWSFAPCR